MKRLSPREATKAFKVSRGTLMKALANGVLSGEKTVDGRWLIEASEMARVYPARETADRPKPAQVSQTEPVQKPAQKDDSELAIRLAKAELALEAEKEKTALLERHLEDVRRLLPAPKTEKKEASLLRRILGV
jgi:hypothetical protein